MMRPHKHPFVYPGDWVEQAACGMDNYERFYPPDDKPVPRDFYRKAKTVCMTCPVIAECGEYGKDETYGVWGATTPSERHLMKQRQRERKGSTKPPTNKPKKK